MKTYNLNLSDSYVQHWTMWEVLREIVCNAQDACNNWKLIECDDGIAISTETYPTLAQMFVLGVSESRDNENAIGQFGEGLKLAALVATRLAKLTISSPEGEISFKFKKVHGVNVLHAIIDETKKSDVFVVYLHSKTLNQYLDCFDFTRSEGHFTDDTRRCQSLWVKGVLIESRADLEYSYQFNSLKLNRDRAVVELSSLYSAFWKYADSMSDVETYEFLLPIIKGSNLERYVFQGRLHTARKFADGLMDSYGTTKVCLKSSPYADHIAELQGYTVIDDEHICVFLAGVLESSSSVQVDDYEVVDQEPYADTIKHLNQLLDDLNIPAPIIQFIRTTSYKGIYDFKTQIVYLNINLIDDKYKLYSALFHELSHRSSNCNDETYEFESSLTDYLGLLAYHFTKLKYGSKYEITI